MSNSDVDSHENVDLNSSDLDSSSSDSSSSLSPPPKMMRSASHDDALPFSDNGFMSPNICKYTLAYLATYGKIECDSPKIGQHTWYDKRSPNHIRLYNQCYQAERAAHVKRLESQGMTRVQIFA